MAYTPDNPARRPRGMEADPLRAALTSPAAYRMATEDISGYLGALRPEGALCLCVAGSGDQAVNLFAAGADRVLSFDRDPVAKRMIDLKFAAIAGLDFDEFKAFFGIEEFGSFDMDVFRAKVAPRLRYRPTWFEARLEDPYSFFLGYTSLPHWNPYLADAEAYGRAQEACRAVIASCGPGYRQDFMECDVRDLATVGGGQFDVIVLSNILDQWVRHIYDSERTVGGLVRDQRMHNPVWQPGWVLSRAVETMVWPTARLLRPGGRMLGGYFYRHDEDEEQRIGNIETAFAPQPGFSTDVIRIPSAAFTSFLGMTLVEENAVSDLAVIVTRDN